MDDDIWSFKIIDMDKTGFARYCPTFVSAYDRIKNYFRIRKYVKENALNDKYDDVRESAAWALREAAENGQNITPAVPALGKALSDGNKLVRWHAAYALRYAVDRKRGRDITPAIPALANALNDKDDDVRKVTAWAFTAHYRNKKNWKKLGELLGHEDKEVRHSAAWALINIANRKRGDITVITALANALNNKDNHVRMLAASALEKAAKKGQDITPAISTLGKALSDKDWTVRSHATEALRDAVYAGQDITTAIPSLLLLNTSKSSDAGDVLFTTIALDKFIEKCDSIEGLDKAQKVIEDLSTEWLRKQPEGPSSEKVRRMLGASKWVMRIAEKKAELFKQDGELLLGETVKKPKDKDKKIYRSLKRVGRNG